MNPRSPIRAGRPTPAEDWRRPDPVPAYPVAVTPEIDAERRVEQCRQRLEEVKNLPRSQGGLVIERDANARIARLVREEQLAAEQELARAEALLAKIRNRPGAGRRAPDGG